MKEEDLNDVIRILEQNSSEEDGYFKFDYDEITENEIIRANLDGLIRYCIELLKSTNEFDKQKLIKESDRVINLDDIGNWYIHEGFVKSIIPLYEKRINIYKKEPNRKKTFKDRISEFGCGLTVVFLGIVIIIGIVSLLNFLIDLV